MCLCCLPLLRISEEAHAMWKKHLERDDSTIVGKESSHHAIIISNIRSMKEASINSCTSSDRPVLRPAAELAALLSLLPLLQHIWCVLWSVFADPQEELWRGGHAKGVSGPLFSGGEAGQGEFTSKFTQLWWHSQWTTNWWISSCSVPAKLAYYGS